MMKIDMHFTKHYDYFNTKKIQNVLLGNFYLILLRICVALIIEYDNIGQSIVRCFLNSICDITYIGFIYWLFDYYNCWMN